MRLLQELGFTEYESKVYLALLKRSPLSGYGVAGASGVPRSKVYEVLRGMVDRGLVLVSHADPAQYAALPPAELAARRRREAESVIRPAEHGLERFAAVADRGDRIWDIGGRDEILIRLREVIGRAQSQILLQVWREDAPELRPDLDAAFERGVQITVVAYGQPDVPFARVYVHEPGAEQITGEYGGRWIILSIDAKEIVAGIVSLGDRSRAAWSTHLGIVMPITEQIKHDLYLAELLLHHRDILEAEFGPSLERLRARFGPPPEAYRPAPALNEPARE